MRLTKRVCAASFPLLTGSGHQGCCALLLDDFKASIDYSGRSGRTALHWAARNGHTELCEWLVNRGEGAIDVRIGWLRG